MFKQGRPASRDGIIFDFSCLFSVAGTLTEIRGDARFYKSNSLHYNYLFTSSGQTLVGFKFEDKKSLTNNNDNKFLQI